MIYTPRHFEQTDLPALHALMRSAPFATLISAMDADVQISHLPVMLDATRGPFGTLSGHLARANPHWRLLGEGKHLIVFQGPHRYISPAWYRHQPSVPTWNYAAVHARGTCTIQEDPAALARLTGAMTAHFESGNGTHWSLPDDPAYLAKMYAGIIGFDLYIETLQGKFKLSQNRPAADREQILAALRASPTEGNKAMLALMDAHSSAG